MSFKLAITTSCRCPWPRRIQSATHPLKFAYTPTSTFTTSSKTLSRYCKESRNHTQDSLQIKKIKQKARKGVFTDSASAKATDGKAPVKADATNPKITENIKHSDKNSQEQQQHDRVYQKASRLRYEDLLGSRQHRQHHLYRMRLMHYMRQHQFEKQQRYQSHGRERGGGHGSGHHHHQGDLSSWWVWHFSESRKIFVRYLILGIVITSSSIWVYNSKMRHWQQWSTFISDVNKIRNDFEDIMGMTKSMPSPRSYFSFSKTPTNSLVPQFSGDVLEGSLSSQSLHSSLKNLKMLTPKQVEIRLGQCQKSFKIVDQESKRKSKMSTLDQKLVLGYCTNQIPSNSTIEDDLSQHVVRDENNEIERIFFGVFDGHSGWFCSQKVAQELAPSVAKELDLIRNSRDTKAVIEAIERGFLKLDQRIVHDSVRRVLEHPSRPLACSSLLPAISGSCALLAYIDPRGRDLYVACAGDSRAVMGVREPLEGGGHVWRAVPLSFDQTGMNRWEVKRLKDEHPGEENTVVMRGGVLGGLEPTRAFGVARYKWSKEIQEKVFQLFPVYRQPYKNLKTPPYITAKPVVQHQKIRPEDRFLVMATDGLWDKLTSDEVVQLVGDLLDGKTGHDEMVLDREEIQKYKQRRRLAIQASSPPSNALHSGMGEQQEEEELTPLNTAAKGPANQIRKFTYRDQANVSTHLIRNALGGADDDKLAATLSIPSPMSRAYRDDITVTVVFFGQQDTTMTLSDAKGGDGLVEIH